VVARLKELDTEFEVWNINLPESVDFSFTTRADESFPFGSVWWRYKGTAEEYVGILDAPAAFATREWLAALRGLAALTATRVRWINNPVGTAVSNLKLRNLQIASEHGFRVPRTIVTNVAQGAEAFLDSVAPKQAIYKPLTYYYEDSGVAVFASQVERNMLQASRDNIRRAPVLLQERIEKRYELRVTVVGREIFAVRIDSQQNETTMLDWRRDQMRQEMYSIVSLTRDDQLRLAGLHEKFGLVYGAYDFIVDENDELVFLEVNPSGQWLWLEHATGVPISASIAQAVAA